MLPLRWKFKGTHPPPPPAPPVAGECLGTSPYRRQKGLGALRSPKHRWPKLAIIVQSVRAYRTTRHHLLFLRSQGPIIFMLLTYLHVPLFQASQATMLLGPQPLRHSLSKQLLLLLMSLVMEALALRGLRVSAGWLDAATAAIC